MIFHTEDEQILTMFNHYEELKKLISKIEELHKYLLDNRIVKRSNSYIVLSGDKFNYGSYSKFKKLLFKEFLSMKDIEPYLILKTMCLRYLEDLETNELVYITDMNFCTKAIIEQIKDDIASQSNYIYELKRMVKRVLKALLLKQEIRQI